MPNIIIYSTDKIEFNKLKSFEHKNFTPLVYGVLNNKWWFIYGNYESEMYNPEKKIFKGVEAYKHITNKAISSMVLLKVCDMFGKHISSKNTDIEVEGIGNGSLINFIKQTNITSLPSGKSISVGENNILYHC